METTSSFALAAKTSPFGAPGSAAASKGASGGGASGGVAGGSSPSFTFTAQGGASAARKKSPAKKSPPKNVFAGMTGPLRNISDVRSRRQNETPKRSETADPTNLFAGFGGFAGPTPPPPTRGFMNFCTMNRSMAKKNGKDEQAYLDERCLFTAFA